MNAAEFNRRMRKTARPVVWEGDRAQSLSLDPIFLHYLSLGSIAGLRLLGRSRRCLFRLRQTTLLPDNWFLFWNNSAISFGGEHQRIVSCQFFIGMAERKKSEFNQGAN